jgi:hypothetical protein
MKIFSVALINLPLLALGAALAQTPAVADDVDLLTPQEWALNRNSDLYPEWTWMTEGQAALVLKAHGYDFIINLERTGQFWRGKAMREGASYHVAITRYAEVFGHMDRKSLIAAAERAQEKASKPSITMLATLNGPVAASTSRVAPTVLTPAKPVATIMGEVAWTWMTEEQAIQILKGKGYTNIGTLRRDEMGIWRTKAAKDGLVSHIALDVYLNVQAELDGGGGLAQATPSD